MTKSESRGMVLTCYSHFNKIIRQPLNILRALLGRDMDILQVEKYLCQQVTKWKLNGT